MINILNKIFAVALAVIIVGVVFTLLFTAFGWVTALALAILGLHVTVGTCATTLFALYVLYLLSKPDTDEDLYDFD